MTPPDNDGSNDGSKDGNRDGNDDVSSDLALDHDHIDELLAGYVLQALDGDDAREADRLLTEHVPTCLVCRATLADFQSLTGDLAFAVAPVSPPDLAWPQIERSMGDKPVRAKRRWAFTAVAASVVAIFGLVGVSVVLSGRMNDAQDNQQQLTNMFKDMLGDDGARMVSLKNPSTQEPTMFVSYLPGQAATRFVGVNVPQPDYPGDVYRVWLVHQGIVTPVGDFIPDEDGIVMIEIPADLSDYDQVTITEEPQMLSSGVASAPTGSSRWVGYITSS